MFYYNNQITTGASRQERLGPKAIDGSTCSITEEVQFLGWIMRIIIVSAERVIEKTY